MTATKWPEVALGDLVTDARSGFASGEHTADGIFQLRMNNVTRSGGLDLTKRRRVPPPKGALERFLVEPGDVVFNATNSADMVGKSAFIRELDEPTTFSNHFIRLRPRRSVDGAFLSRWLHRQFERGVFEHRCRRWVNQATFDRGALLSMRVPLPPIEEQRRIAALLDQAGAMRATRREALDHLDTLTDSIFLEMFGDRRTRSRGFPLVPLESLVDPSHPITRGIDQPGPDVEDGVPYLKTTDFSGPVSRDSLARSDPSIAAKFPRSFVREGDSVICIRATVGPAMLINRELSGVNLSRGTARVAPGPGVAPEFLLGALRSKDFQNQIAERLRGATFLQIPLSELKKLIVPIPPGHLQKEYARRVHAIDQAIAESKASLAALDELFASLQQRAFRGAL